MSRVYRALEKAERERDQQVKQDPLPKVAENFAPPKVVEDFRPPKQEKVVVSHPPVTAKTERLSGSEELPVLIAAQESFAAEQFRKLKTQIFHGASNIPHFILVTSAFPGEGKTLVSVNLAVAISHEIHRKAILIDADLRKPSIPFQGKGNSKGLLGYLQDQTPLTDILLKSEEENLWMIPAGPPSSRSTELIGSNRMKELLVSLREFGDDTFVIIDSPPIHATSDPIVLSKMVDGIVFVTMADRTPRESVRRAMASLDRQKILGVVFNQKEMAPLLKYYSSHNRYYDRYHRKPGK
jgi:protein-tyrosine kinase